MKTSIAELQLLSESEIYFRIAERVEEFECAQSDWQEVLAQKWIMQTLSDSNPFLGGR